MKLGTVVYYILFLPLVFLIFFQENWSPWLIAILVIVLSTSLRKVTDSVAFLQKKIHFLAGCGVLYGMLIIWAAVLEYIVY
ncbi:hypothetical protein [Fictibacillus arsenicus]|uniref:Uncharacterized protein n=1 Tax=Fictibacillus arsenicus TaxID=255247 RepID=A0A1V3G7L6_9BACL|nr:hypothetical protein [Fictibacillus arsenicus]OOE12403.1 hypothetical protein UN64_09885 [Fictibacillus arsenicus]